MSLSAVLDDACAATNTELAALATAHKVVAAHYGEIAEQMTSVGEIRAQSAEQCALVVRAAIGCSVIADRIWRFLADGGIEAALGGLDRIEAALTALEAAASTLDKRTRDLGASNFVECMCVCPEC